MFSYRQKFFVFFCAFFSLVYFFGFFAVFYAVMVVKVVIETFLGLAKIFASCRIGINMESQYFDFVRRAKGQELILT